MIENNRMLDITVELRYGTFNIVYITFSAIVYYVVYYIVHDIVFL